MFKVIDEMSELIYIVDMDSYELLYMNRAGLDSFGLHEITGMKCHAVLHGKEEPCEFCNNRFLSEETFYTWECPFSRLNKHYLLKDKIIGWEGKKAKVEIAFDMTEKERQRTELKEQLIVENLVTGCAKKLCVSDQKGEGIKEVLSMVGDYMKADRVMILQPSKEGVVKTYEWDAQGVIPASGFPAVLPENLRYKWKELLMRKKMFLYPYTGEAKEGWAGVPDSLMESGIHTLAVTALLLDGSCLGYLRVDNFTAPYSSGVNVLLTSVSFFLAAALYRKWSMKQLEHLGFYDTLTGLMNRNGYIRDLEMKFRPPVGTIYIDINGIKEKNDRMGHQYGDSILLDAAETIRARCPEELKYRVGGDEFVIICQQVRQEKFQYILQSLRLAFEQKTDYTVAIGSCWSREPANIQQLLYKADEKMYLDKQAYYRKNGMTGRYRFCLDDIYGISQPGKLQQGLREKQFHIYYQPKFSISDFSVRGAEALIRYQINDGNVVPPDQFIPVLEEVRLIGLLDFYVIEEVCRQQKKWLYQGFRPFPVSVNVSRHTLALEDFEQQLECIVRKYNVPSELIEIEITETVEEDDRSFISCAARKLRKKNFRILIDDFGVRNANLSLFTDVDFDILKIDRHMTELLATSRKSRLLVGSLVELCHQMDITLIAEGIETSEQLELLRVTGCDEGQGYLFSRPLSREDFEQTYLECRSIKNGGYYETRQ